MMDRFEKLLTIYDRTERMPNVNREVLVKELLKECSINMDEFMPPKTAKGI